MKFTSSLNKHNTRRMWKATWKNKFKFHDRPMIIPKNVLTTGLPIIVNPAGNTPTVFKPEPVNPQHMPHQDKTLWPDYQKQKAYIYTRRQRVMEGCKQACILTKSLQFNGFPESLKPLIGKIDVPNQDKLLQRYIMQSQVWDGSKEKLPRRIDTANVGYKFTREYGITRKRSTDILMSNLIRLCQMSSSDYPSVLTDLRVLPYSYLGTHYYFQDNLVNIQALNRFLVMSKTPLKPFADENMIDDSANQELPDLFPISPLINIDKTNNYTVQNTPGYIEGLSSFHPHTIFCKNVNFWSNELRQASALLISFGYALSQARKLYGDQVSCLPQPICVQCVNMDISTINFTFFQLNTTNFSNNNGIKNFVWFDNSNHLFKKQLPQPWLGPDHQQTSFHSYNPEGFQKLLTVFLSNERDSFKDTDSELGELGESVVEQV